MGETRFEALLIEHRGIVFKIANAYCRDPEERRDLAQDIYTQLWRAFPRYDPGRSFSTWMYRIALNVAISHRRSFVRRDRHLSQMDEAALEAVADPREPEGDARVRELYRVIDQLDGFNRALILLYLEGRNQREMADVLGISETNVATKLSRLRQRLRQDMAEPAP